MGIHVVGRLGRDLCQLCIGLGDGVQVMECIVDLGNALALRVRCRGHVLQQRGEQPQQAQREVGALQLVEMLEQAAAVIKAVLAE